MTERNNTEAVRAAAKRLVQAFEAVLPRPRQIHSSAADQIVTVNDLMAQLEVCPVEWTVELLVPNGAGLLFAHRLGGMLIDRSILEDHGCLMLTVGERTGQFTVAELAHLRSVRR